jgi:hypothetical protein
LISSGLLLSQVASINAFKKKIKYILNLLYEGHQPCRLMVQVEVDGPLNGCTHFYINFKLWVLKEILY